MAKQQPEPWLRGTRTEVDAVQRAILHALDLAWEDIEVWCGELSDAELRAALELSAKRVLAFSPANFNDERGVGKRMLPTNVGGLLVHCADHTQRHVGQAVITAKVVMGMRQLAIT
jgi:hypothetical protein